MPPPIYPATADVLNPKVRMPTSKGAKLQPIAISTRVRTTTPATNSTLTASLNQTHAAPVAQQTFSHTLAVNISSSQNYSSRIYPQAFLYLWYIPVLDKTTGQLLNYQQLQHHLTLANTCNTSFFNEIGRLCQVVGVGSDGKVKIVDGI